MLNSHDRPTDPGTQPNRSRRDTRRQQERGASELLMLIMMIALIGFAGIAYDAGMAFNARRQATNVATAAARAGANEVETDALYLIGVPLPDNSKATEAARRRVQVAGLTVLEARVRNGIQVEVKVQATHQTTFLQVVGIGSLTIEAEARAMAQSLARG